ncbi:MAG TPA: DNA alkylation repair protein [Candidatus Nanoarchaeia archaeon]|nr:DNA alkylation repair protein [Candidatus Nanoarchaeia archaeon]
MGITITGLNAIRRDLREAGNSEKARILQRFFKTGEGEYGQGDVFLGVTVPESRKIAQKYGDLSFPDVKALLDSKIHEERLVAILLLVHAFQRGDEKRVVDFYLSHTKKINNWDLVDLSADKILGAYLLSKKKDVLYKLAKSDNIWERRISIVSTYSFIKNGKFDDVLKISELLLDDMHDLIHKAGGWMLREVGKRNQAVEEGFLKRHYLRMPRTMLRYAIERLPESKKRVYMRK